MSTLEENKNLSPQPHKVQKVFNSFEVTNPPKYI